MEVKMGKIQEELFAGGGEQDGGGPVDGVYIVDDIYIVYPIFMYVYLVPLCILK